MKTRFLFPHQLRFLGWILALPGLVLGYFIIYRDYQIPGFGVTLRQNNSLFHGPVFQNLTNTAALMAVVIGLFLVAFSKEKREDELSARMRQNALYWGVLVNYMLYLAWLLFFTMSGIGKSSLDSLNDIGTLCTYNLFTPLIIVIARYYYLRYSKSGEYKIDRLIYLPSRPFKLIGQFVSVPLLAIIVFSVTGSWFFKQSPDLKDWTQGLMMFLPISLLLWGYSRQQNEDEFISTLRRESMQLAVYLNYAVLLLANFFFFFTDFLLIMVINLGTISLFFLLRFNYILWINNKENLKGNLAL